MGQSCSHNVKKNVGFNNKDKGKKVYLKNEEGEGMLSSSMRGLPIDRPELPEHSQEIVVQSWDVIKKDIERVGVVMFMG